METARKKRPPLEERLVTGLQELEEWARGERDDLRVTKVTIPDETEPRTPHQPVRTPHK